MNKVNKIENIEKARGAKNTITMNSHRAEAFTPCSQDMTICGDCDGNRAKNTCPRLKEWLAKRRD
jgi:hypothetical protein